MWNLLARRVNAGSLVLLLAAVPFALAQEDVDSGGGQSMGGAGIGVGSADKAPASGASSGGSGACVDKPENPAPPGGALFAGKTIEAGATFPDVAFHQGKIWLIYRAGESIKLMSGKPDLSDLALVKTFPLLKGAGGFPRLTVACGTLWAAWRDGEPEEAIKLWRADTEKIENLGPGWGNHPVTLGNGMVAWNGLDRGVYRRGLAGGTKTRVRDAMPTGLSRILPGGAVKWWDEDRLAVPWGVGAWFAGDLISAEDFHDNGTWAKVGSKAPVHLWAGARAFTAKAAADGAGRYAVAVWQPSVRIMVFSAAGLAGAASGGQDPIVWAHPATNSSGSGRVQLAGVASSAVKKVEILVNLKKVGDAKLLPLSWIYDLDTAPFSGGINVSALATLADGKTFRQTIRYNVTR